MRCCFSTLGCPEWNLTRIADRAKHYGFDGVELRIDGKKHIDPSMSGSERAAVKRLFADAGLAVAAISGYTQFAGDDLSALRVQHDNLIRNIDLAHDIGAPYVRTFICGADGGVFCADGARALHSAGERAKAQGVTVLIETHDALTDSGERTKALLDAVDSEGVAALWDMHHTLRHHETPEETYAALGTAIKHTHLKDADANHALCLPGEGSLPIGKVIRVLSDHGYQGFLSFEWEKMWVSGLQEPEIAFPRFMEHIRSLSR
ncbi:MAG: sugar phosphate isomerase/epimerase [Clostridia bacterium]|nr:sugar phosphate isomerase/epimerase [Clostridia bacterium]